MTKGRAIATTTTMLIALFGMTAIGQTAFATNDVMPDGDSMG